ncbi:MAG: proline--tRNA ligase [Ignavibacteriae bacterium HGW-Ignavibacteriae-4]|jgi:prolyl-tRNA synthetase|nr:MAG: proline--tRNA ligase [Ignavibacteriae bacterium HGW-Ignavibacteriae-4]
MYQSQFFIPTLKEIPNDAQMPSHQLMLRAGLIRQIAAGVFSWLPLGYKVLKKVQDILREEMDAIGGQEFLLPALNPKEIWEQTNRVEAMGDVMFHIKNRDNLILAPTHEEIIAYHASQSVKSYKEVPQIWYQIQNKFRNEPRPKSGVMRGRQFLMKDSYSLDATEEGLDISYEKHSDAYHKIFNRCGIKFFVVGASSGAMGGSKSQEFMVENPFGEDTCAVNYESGYSSNIEVAVSSVEQVGRIENCPEIEKFATPNAKTIKELSEQFDLPIERCAKSVVYIIDSKPVLILMRGIDELNESKLQSFFGTNNVRPADESEILDVFGAHPGSLGPINIKKQIQVFADNLLHGANGLVSGANEDGQHFKNIDLERDCKLDGYEDFRTVLAGEADTISGNPLKVVNAIELGHIFKLGTKYSEALGAKILDENGKEKPIIMGSYGIGVERVLACVIEQNHDENGIIWNKGLTPFHVHILGLAFDKSEQVQNVCNQLKDELERLGLEVLLDDRKERPGFKFKDADLIGIPVQVVIGDRGLEENKVELKFRKTGEKVEISPDNIVESLTKFYEV